KHTTAQRFTAHSTATAGSTRVAPAGRASPAPTTGHPTTPPPSPPATPRARAPPPAVSASDTVGSANRRPITVATAAITVTASANTPPAASGITGSGSTARNQTVNVDRTASALGEA